MSKFKDNVGQRGIMHSLIKNNEFKFFKTKMEIMHGSFDILINFDDRNVWDHPLLHILVQNSQFHEYIQKQYSKQYKQSLLDFFPKISDVYYEGHLGLFSDLSKNYEDEVLAQLLKTIFDVIGDDYQQFMSLISHHAKGERTKISAFLGALLMSEGNYSKSFALILKNQYFSDKQIFKIIGIGKHKNTQRTWGIFSDAMNVRVEGWTLQPRHIVLQTYKHVSGDKHEFYRILMDKEYGLTKALKWGGRNACKILDLLLDSPLFSRNVCNNRNSYQFPNVLFHLIYLYVFV